MIDRSTETLSPSARGGGRWSRRLVHSQLVRLERGVLRLADPCGEASFGSPDGGLEATITVTDMRFYRAALLGGDVAVAEAYGQGWWECDDLVALVRIFVRNDRVLHRMQTGLARLGDAAFRLVHALHRNTRRGSRRNIAAHYDLGNRFFEQFLDASMMYSCAVFPGADSTLEEASLHKIDRICRKLDLQPTDRLLEIGTGWGALAVHAAARYGCHVTTTTISREQHEHAAERVRRAGLERRVTLLLSDYRDVEGRFDKLVSIEMIEAVGHHYYDGFFRKCGELLETDGLMLLQAILISDWAFERAKRSVDFIKSHIFPGSCIPSVTALCQSATRTTDLRTFHLEDIGPHYARTLREWRRRFNSTMPQIRQMGFPESFLRLWDYYFAYCEGGFEERYISNAQILFARPENRRQPILPSLDHTVETAPTAAPALEAASA